MGLGKLLAGLSAGGASVDTALDDPHTRPGGTLTGEVRLAGGDMSIEVQSVGIDLVVRAEVESGDADWTTGVPILRQPLHGGLRLDAGSRHALRFSLTVPWETPITAYGGWHLRGMDIGVRTDVAISRGVDKDDLDPVTVHPLPSQERVLAALDRLGFRFTHADCEVGRLPGSSLPLYQEIELAPPSRYAGRINQLEVTFLARPDAMDVVLEADRRGGLLTEGRDALRRVRVEHAALDATDWERVLDEQVGQLAARRGWL
ncbi:MAG: sporulation protein [Actinomycetes bacterium]